LHRAQHAREHNRKSGCYCRSSLLSAYPLTLWDFEVAALLWGGSYGPTI
jgi:hypothetical protein